jgi:allantoinase
LKAAYDYINRFDGVVHWNGTQLLNWFQGQKLA